jgi:hydroxymethylglutaryl-CoA lyase
MDFSIYEVGPRDGLQSSDTITPTYKKVELIERLAKAGIQNIEVGAMVNPEKVPNMADSAKVYEQISHLEPFCNLGVLIPNKRGLDRAREVGASKFNVFFSPSDYFNTQNFGRSMASIFSSYCQALEDVPKRDVRVYLSTSFGCPIGGEVPRNLMDKALDWADTLGSTIVLCDTIGKANPSTIRRTMKLTERIDADIALHLHHGKRKGRMYDNLSAAFDCGVKQFDSSIGGMGGCPFVPGSGGNLATEELIMWGDKEKLDCGVSISDLRPIIDYVETAII